MSVANATRRNYRWVRIVGKKIAGGNLVREDLMIQLIRDHVVTRNLAFVRRERTKGLCVHRQTVSLNQ